MPSTTTTTIGANYLATVINEVNLALSAKTIFVPGGVGFNTNTLDIKDMTGVQGMTARFGEVNAFTASIVDEDTEYAAYQATTPTSVTITACRHVVGTRVTKQSIMGAVNEFDIWKIAGRQLAQAMGNEIDTTVTTSFASFGTTIGTTNTDITLANITEAAQTLRNANVDEKITIVLHGNQWDDLMNEDDSPLVNAGMNQMAEGYWARWFYTDLFDLTWLVSNSVQTANAGEDYCGAMFSSKAIGLVWKGAPEIEYEWNKDAARWDILLSAYFAVDVVDDDRGLKIVTDV